MVDRIHPDRVDDFVVGKVVAVNSKMVENFVDAGIRRKIVDSRRKDLKSVKRKDLEESFYII
jgi:hypothetical protein